MSKNEMIKKFEGVIRREIQHSESCMNRDEVGSESHTFWQGAWIQVKEIMNQFRMEFRP